MDRRALLALALGSAGCISGGLTIDYTGSIYDPWADAWGCNGGGDMDREITINIERGQGRLGLGPTSGYGHCLCVGLSTGSPVVYRHNWVGTASTPVEIWDRRGVSISLPADIDGDQLVDLLETDAAQEAIRAIAADYAGSCWDGSREIGRWATGGVADQARRDLAELVDALPTYWSAGDWLYPSRHDAAERAAGVLGRGLSLDDWAQQEAADAPSDVLLSPDELVEALRDLVQAEPELVDPSWPGADRLLYVCGRLPRLLTGEP